MGWPTKRKPVVEETLMDERKHRRGVNVKNLGLTGASQHSYSAHNHGSPHITQWGDGRAGDLPIICHIILKISIFIYLMTQNL